MLCLRKKTEKSRTWLTAFNTICSFWRWPSSDWVTSGTSSLRLVNFSHNLCNTCPSYKSSSMFLTIIRSSANSSLIQSINNPINSLTSGSFSDCGWIMARCSLSPENKEFQWKIYSSVNSVKTIVIFKSTYVKYNLLVEYLVDLEHQGCRLHVGPPLGFLVLWVDIYCVGVKLNEIEHDPTPKCANVEYVSISWHEKNRTIFLWNSGSIRLLGSIYPYKDKMSSKWLMYVIHHQ